MLELATLGLLQQEPLHGYRLKQQLELCMSSCISVNYGAIYPLLKRLEKRDYISVLIQEAREGGSSRKIYSITPTGKQRWREKMLEHPQESWVNSRSRFMIKFFFFQNLSPTERLELLTHRLQTCQQRYENRDIEIPLNDDYQQAAWNRYRVVLLSEIQWIEQQLTLEAKL
jgi:DNA-binding PadR family transcriptional regulator